MIIRKATMGDEDGIARVHVDSWRTTYKGIVSDDYLRKLSYEQRAENWRRGIGNSTLYVAEENEQIVGFATGGNERTGNYDADAELYAIYLLQSVQGQGVGKQLVRKLAEEMIRLNFGSLLVWVLEQNPSKKFYESLGGKKIDDSIIDIGGVEFKEIAYYWESLELLMKAGINN